MMSKGLLLARPVGNLIQRRGKAVQAWKRPTMDEYLGPKEPWEKVPFIFYVSTFRGGGGRHCVLKLGHFLGIKM